MAPPSRGKIDLAKRLTFCLAFCYSTRMSEVCLILHNLRSAQNVGAIFRTAEAAGVSKIYLTGYTPAPLDRFGRPNQAVLKSSLGAENYIEWKAFKNLSDLISKLKARSLPDGKAGYKLIALEQQFGSIDYKKVKIKQPTAIILGNEVTGISKSILKQCDIVAEIPMRGKKESLNVSVACGIFLFQIL